MKKKVHIIIDGNNLFYRCFYAARGKQDQSFRIFYSLMRKILYKFRNHGSKLYFFWDSPKNWRTNVSGGYKQDRRDQRIGKQAFFDRLYFAMDLMKSELKLERFSRVQYFKQYQIKGYEADDVISLFLKTAIEKYSGEKQYFLIVSTDKDYMQLIADDNEKSVVQLKMGKEWKFVTYKSFCSEFGISPEQYPSILALMGDKSDSVKGVPGIGEKRAIEVVKKHGDVRDWIFSGDDLGCDLRRKCLDNRDGIQRDLMLVDLQNSRIFGKEVIELED